MSNQSSTDGTQPRVLLVVSADVSADQRLYEDGLSPRRDYQELARSLGADILDFGSVKRSGLGRLLARFLGRGIVQTLAALPRLRRYEVVFCDSEHVGLFLGIAMRLLPSRPRHLVLAHYLTPRKKHLFVRLARPGVDLFILHSPAQQQFAEQNLGLKPGQTLVLPYQVDVDFWKAEGTPQNLITTAGLECRDYETLVAAVDGLDLDVAIGAASNWSHKRNRLSGLELPRRVVVTSYSYLELRDHYSRSSCVVVPLDDVDFQAGITTALEAMSMGRPTIVTQTRGIRHFAKGPLWSAFDQSWPQNGPSVEESACIFVRPNDAAALRQAIQWVVANPGLAQSLGENARRYVTQELTTDHFVDRFSAAILAVAQGGQADGRESLSSLVPRDKPWSRNTPL